MTTIDAEVVWESARRRRRRQRCGRRHHGRGLARHPVDGRGRESNDTRHRRGRRRGVEDGCRRERYCRRRHRSPATSGLVAGQLGGDEVVAFTTESGSLIVLNPADGTERLAVDLGGPGGLRPAIGDLDGDGDAEIAAVTTDGRVRAVDAAGETVFETDLDAPVNRRPLAVVDSAVTLTAARTTEPTPPAGSRSRPRPTAIARSACSTRPARPGGRRPRRSRPLSWSGRHAQRSGLVLGARRRERQPRDDRRFRRRNPLRGRATGSTRRRRRRRRPRSRPRRRERQHLGGRPARRRSRLETAVRRRYAGKRSRCRGRDRRRLSGPGRGESGWRRARTEPEGRGDRPRQYRYRRRVRGPLFADVTGDGSAEVLIVAEDGRIVALSD